jgi:hypothetical protein
LGDRFRDASAQPLVQCLDLGFQLLDLLTEKFDQAVLGVVGVVGCGGFRPG